MVMSIPGVPLLGLTCSVSKWKAAFSLQAGSMTAAFASSSLVFKNLDKAYAQTLLNTAAALYTAAQAYPGT